MTAVKVRNWKNRKNNGINQYIILYWVNWVLGYILLLNILLTVQRVGVNTWFIQQLPHHFNGRRQVWQTPAQFQLVPVTFDHQLFELHYSELSWFLSRPASLSPPARHVFPSAVVPIHLFLHRLFLYFLIHSAESAILTPAHSNEQINEENWSNKFRMVLCLW